MILAPFSNSWSKLRYFSCHPSSSCFIVAVHYSETHIFLRENLSSSASHKEEKGEWVSVLTALWRTDSVVFQARKRKALTRAPAFEPPLASLARGGVRGFVTGS
jgi:hypothetical protein